MSREVHVRFCERLGVKLPRSTHVIVTAQTREQIEEVVAIMEEWLSPRGLRLHPEKTKIIHADNGFKFLGFSIRRYEGKCLVKPQKEKVLSFIRSIGRWLSEHRQVTPEAVIGQLNPRLRGWANHYRHAVSKRTFSYVRDRVWRMLWHWCLQRHPNKTKTWVGRKYFGTDGGSWTFQVATIRGYLSLLNIGATAIERHVKVRADACVDDPDLREYWALRNRRRGTRGNGL